MNLPAEASQQRGSIGGGANHVAVTFKIGAGFSGRPRRGAHGVWQGRRTRFCYGKPSRIPVKARHWFSACPAARDRSSRVVSSLASSSCRFWTWRAQFPQRDAPDPPESCQPERYSRHQHHKHQMEERMRLRPIWQNPGLVFPRGDGAVLGILTIQVPLATICRRAGVDSVSKDCATHTHLI